MNNFTLANQINTTKIILGSVTKTSQSRIVKSQAVLPLIEEMLLEQKLTLKDITEITVVTGPGSFTGLRVGATVANALGYLLGVPVNGKRDLVIPTYT